MNDRNLHEAKNVGDHARAQSPWQKHPIGSTIRAAVQPERETALQRSGRAKSEPRFRALQANFRRDLGGVFKSLQAAGVHAPAPRGKKPDPRREALAVERNQHLQNITPRKVKALFRQHYTMAFKLGRQAGGAVKLTGLPELRAEDKRWLETFLRKEFDFWKNFTNDVVRQAGRLPYQQRLEMYIQTLSSVYHTARVLEVPPQTLFFWKTQPAEHCPHCLYLARKGPFTRANLPTVPASGDTQCKSNCKCKLIARQVPLAEYWKVSRNGPSRQQLLREMKAVARA